jgi:hypothetical protein
LSVLEVITLVAGVAFAGSVGGGAEIGNGHTDVVLVEGPSVGAFQAFLSIPVPGSASEIRRSSGVGGRVDAVSVDHIVALEAGKALSGGLIERVALSRDSGADSISVEEGSVGALDTFLAGPNFAEEVAIGDDADVGVGDTGAIDNEGAVVAGLTLSALLPGGAEIAHGNADFLSVEEPTLGALHALSVVPDSAADVGSHRLVELGALAVNDHIALVALLADSFLSVELLTSLLDFTANAVLVEEVSFGALQAGVLAPDLTAEVVIELG